MEVQILIQWLLKALKLKLMKLMKLVRGTCMEQKISNRKVQQHSNLKRDIPDTMDKTLSV